MGLSRGTRTIELPSKDFASGGNPTIELGGALADHRVQAIEHDLEVVITNDGTAVVVTGDKLIQLLDSIKVGKRADGLGVYWRLLNILMDGFDPSLPADVPAVNAGVYTRNIRVKIPYADFSAGRPLDTAVLIELLKNQQPVVKFGALATLFPHFASVTGKLNTRLVCDPAPADAKLGPVYMGHHDSTGRANVIEMTNRELEYLFIFKRDGAALTSAEIASVELKVDGETVWDKVNIGELARAWNIARAKGPSRQVTDATNPVGMECLNDQQNVGNGLSGWSLPVIPVYFPGARFSRNAAGTIPVAKSITLNTTGTLTDFVIGHRLLEVLSPDQVSKAQRKAAKAA
jgi:hypothetical protein